MSVKRSYRVLGMVLALTLVLMPAAAMAAMWVGGEVGGNFTDNTDMRINDAAGRTWVARNVKVEPSVIGGLTIGYDFVNSGFLAYNWPDWMKYFSFAIDFTYNRMDIRNQQVAMTRNGVRWYAVPNVNPTLLVSQGARAEGYVAALTFLFMAHYGFFPDSVVPAGRVHPYVGVGPAVVFTGFDLGDLGMGNNSSADVALVVEGGVRVFALKNVSIDTAFRYRYARPSYSFTSGGSVLPAGRTPVGLDANLFTFLVRANYHF